MEHCRYCDEAGYVDVILSEEPYIGLELWNWDGRVKMITYGSGHRCSYTPKFCPECGRKLREEDNL